MGPATRKNPILDGVYPVKVDHSLSFDQMVEAGKYDEVSEGASAREYPIVPTSGVSEVGIRLFCFFREYLTTQQVVRRMKQRGYRPATVPELLALGAAYPELQLGGDIVELGTLDITDEEDLGILVLGKTDNFGRELSHDAWDSEWDSSSRFAAVPL